MSLSSTEAECVALAEAVKKIVWLRNVLLKLGVHQDSSSIFQDNVGCVEWANAGVAKDFSKSTHIDIKHISVMSIADSSMIKLLTVRTTDMMVEFLTKQLTPKVLKRANDVINNFD